MNRPMKILLYCGDSQVAGDPEEDEARLLKGVVQRYFYPSPHSRFIAWLFFQTKTGEGIALAVGGFIPKPGARQKMWRKGLGLAPVPTKFQPLLLAHGPEALRWDGKQIVAAGH